MSITFRNKGNFEKTEKFLKKSFGRNYMDVLDHYGRIGVEELSKNTPRDSGLTASSWSYSIEKGKDGSISVVWSNGNVNNHVNIAVILQYGHGTRNGGWVEGIDYINPALKSVFEELADSAWKEVTRA